MAIFRPTPGNFITRREPFQSATIESGQVKLATGDSLSGFEEVRRGKPILQSQLGFGGACKPGRGWKRASAG